MEYSLLVALPPCSSDADTNIFLQN